MRISSVSSSKTDIYHYIPLVPVVTTVVRQFVLPYFRTLRQTCFLLAGGVTIYTGVNMVKKGQGNTEKVIRAAWTLFAGSALITSGMAGVISELDILKKGYETPWAKQMGYYSNCFFLLSSIIEIKNSVDIYNEGQSLLTTDPDKAARLMNNAKVKFIGAFCYTISSLLLLFTTLQEVASALSYIASTITCIDLICSTITI